MKGIEVWKKFGFTKYKNYNSFLGHWEYWISEDSHLDIHYTCEEYNHRFEVIKLVGGGYGVFDFETGHWAIVPKYSYIEINRQSENDFIAKVLLYGFGEIEEIEVEHDDKSEWARDLEGVFHNKKLVLPICDKNYYFVNDFLIQESDKIYNSEGELLCNDIINSELLLDAVDGKKRYSMVSYDFHGCEYEDETEYSMISSVWSIIVNSKYEIALCKKDKFVTDFLFTNFCLILRSMDNFDQILFLTKDNKYGVFSLKNGWILEPKYDSINLVDHKYYHVNDKELVTLEGKCILQSSMLKHIGFYPRLGNVHVFKMEEKYIFFDSEEGCAVSQNLPIEYLKAFEKKEKENIAPEQKYKYRRSYRLCKFSKSKRYEKEKVIIDDDKPEE